MIQISSNAVSVFEVRTVRSEDFLDLATLGKAFYAEGGLPGTFSTYYFTESWNRLLESGVGEMWVLTKDGRLCGAIGFIVTCDLNDGAPVASELFWFLSPEARGHGLSLLDKFEERARNRGCKRQLMVHLSSLRGETLSRLYQRRGYKLLESHFIKEIN